MELLELYKEENRDILYSMSWLNKNSIFDKSIGSFQDIDLFTFLENINQFDYKKDTFYDDVYYILEYTHDTILHLIKNINKETKRRHRIMPISQAKEFDRESIIWLSRKNGRTIKEKLSNGKIKAVQRYSNIDTYENRIFKILLKKLVLVYEERDDLEQFENLFLKIKKWLKSEEANSIDEYKNVVYNNILLHHQHYNKIFKSYKKLNRLDEKYLNLINKQPNQLRTIIKFDILAQLQFLSSEYILPSTLDIDLDSFNIKEDDSLVDIDLIIKKIKNDVIQDKLAFSLITSFSKYIIKKELNIKQDQNRTFNIDESEIDEVYVDLFRLFPIAQREKQTIKFPITLKQKIDDKIINANNTKIINLNHELYTLPEILKTYDVSLLRYFLEDFSKYFNSAKVNYIVPDYVNVFEFSTAKKVINSYFKNNRSVPKSILAGLKYILSENVNANDTLLYIQKDHNNNLFVTPLLVKFDEKLKSITNGLYLERHPTKKLENSDDIINSLDKIFPSNISKQLLSKFLQNGIKGLKEEKVVFYHNKQIIKLDDFNIPKSEHNYTSLDKIKNLYHKNNLFNENSIFIDDDKVENLKIYEQLLNYEVDGFILWREHLPDLSMEIIRDGYFDEFILVDGKTQIIDKKIEIKGHFTIPKGISELSFPLVFDNKKIGYIANLKSKDFPFSENIECTLELIYDYESEELYTLTFLPTSNNLSTIKVKWQKEKEKSYESLIYPEYPANINLENSIEDEIIKEFKQLEKDFKAVKGNRFHDKSNFFLKSSYKKALFSKYWQNGNSIVNSQNNELKQLIHDNLNIFINCQNEIPNVLKSNIYLFLSYIHQDLIVNKETIFILNEFKSRNNLYGLSIGCITTEWQNDVFKDIFKLETWRQVQVLNIALWRCDRIIEKIPIQNIKILLNFIEKKLKDSKNENDIVTYLEFLLASLRTKNNNEILHPNKFITKSIQNILKSRSKYFVEHYELKSKISFGKIDKPENLQQMPDLLYAVIYYLSNEDIENKIIINEVKP